jgi:hypothetical protein
LFGNPGNTRGGGGDTGQLDFAVDKTWCTSRGDGAHRYIREKACQPDSMLPFQGEAGSADARQPSGERTSERTVLFVNTPQGKTRWSFQNMNPAWDRPGDR